MVYDSRLLRDIIEWEVKSWGRALSLWDEVLPATGEGLSALDLGSRRGGLTLHLARKGYRVTCTDLENPETASSPLHRKYDVSSAVTYAAADATCLPFSDESFDAVTFKSLLGSVGYHQRTDLQLKAIAEVRRVLKPGGYMLFAENLKATRVHMLLRRKFNRWGSECQYMDLNDFRRSLAEFSACKYKTFGLIGALGRTEWQRDSLYYFDLAIDGFLPESCKYLIYGYARK